jgi:alkyl hydroperoxide reductase subunit AhpC
MSLLVGNKAPFFKGKAVVGGDATLLNTDNAYFELSSDDYLGKWLVLFFYPLDFTFVCPTEIEEFGKNYAEFQKLNCEVIACSTDSHHSHLAWRSTHPSLRNLPYPMLADPNHETSKAFEILMESKGFTLRGLYIINPEGELVYSVIHPEDVGRNSKEILRVVSALQTGVKTPCNWEPGEATL